MTHFKGVAARCIFLALSGVSALPAVVSADASVEDRLRDALRQTTLQLREAQDQNAELQAKQQALEQQLSRGGGKPQQTAPAVDSAQLAGLRRALADKSAALSTLQQQLDDSRKAQAEWQQARDQAAEAARKRDADATKYQGLFERADARSHTCEQKNQALYALDSELLERYKNKGVWESVKGDEPFTRIHQVKIEKIAQDYHDKLVDQKVSPDTGPGDAK